MGRPFIVLGDSASHGGRVTCPGRAHGATAIVPGDPVRILDGIPAAGHGAKRAFGATRMSSQVRSPGV